jgi:hypothetical protein
VIFRFSKKNNFCPSISDLSDGMNKQRFELISDLNNIIDKEEIRKVKLENKEAFRIEDDQIGDLET